MRALINLVGGLLFALNVGVAFNGSGVAPFNAGLAALLLWQRLGSKA